MTDTLIPDGELGIERGAGQTELVSRELARELMQEHRIELFDDPRSAQQYITELLVYVDAVQRVEAEAAVEHESNRGNAVIDQKQVPRERPPYFAR